MNLFEDVCAIFLEVAAYNPSPYAENSTLLQHLSFHSTGFPHSPKVECFYENFHKPNGIAQKKQLP